MINANKFTIKGKEYSEDRLLAEGGYGYVYMVEDPDTGNKLALKKMIIQTPEQQKDIKREIELWKRFNGHPNIVTLVDYELTTDQNGNKVIYLLMELSDKGTILDYIQSKTETIEEKEILNIINQISLGIFHLHSQLPKISHRDIKIENVLRFQNSPNDFTYKLCDFGSSTTHTLDPKNAERGEILETFSRFEKTTTFMYRPPEMCDPYSKWRVDEKVDIWMLGCILYALMFKKHPFADAQKLTIINAHYYVPEDGYEFYSEKIVDFMRYMLTPNPEHRPSIEEVLKIIREWERTSEIILSDEVKEIKSKHLENYEHSSSKKKELLSNEDIYNMQKKMNKNMQQAGSSGKKQKKKEEFDTDNILDSKPHGKGGWLVDFDNQNNNNNSDKNQSNNVKDSTFDFDFLDGGNSNNINNNINNFNNNAKQNTKSKVEHSEFDFVSNSPANDNKPQPFNFDQFDNLNINKNISQSNNNISPEKQQNKNTSISPNKPTQTDKNKIPSKPKEQQQEKSQKEQNIYDFFK